MKRFFKYLFILLITIPALSAGGYYGWQYYLDNFVEVVVFEPNYKYPTINIPVIQGNSIAKYVTIELSMNLKDEEAKTKFIKMQPHLTNAYLTVLMDYFSAIQMNQPISQTRIERRLVSATINLVGQDVVTELRLDGAFERRNRQ